VLDERRNSHSVTEAKEEAGLRRSVEPEGLKETTQKGLV